MRLNLGCGDLYVAGWVNVDLPGTPFQKDEAVDLRGPLPWAPGSVTHVYAGHFLEHLTVADGSAMLGRLLPLMAPGGQIVAVGPDVVRGKAMFDRAEIPAELWQVMRAGAGARRWPGDEHHWDCEPLTLRRMLTGAGWADVAEVPIGDVPGFWPVAARPEWQCAVTGRRGERTPHMCHASVLSYVTEILPAAAVRGRWVLEVGSYDVNGSPRSVIAPHGPATYLGVDASQGPGVDEVVDCAGLAEWAGDTCWDLVVSTEMLEHVRDWQACLSNLLAVVADGGLLLLTTRSPGFPFHPFPEDHWRYPVDVLGELLASAGFEVLDLRADPDPASPGVLALARRPAGWEWPPGKTPAELWAGTGVLPV